MKQTRKQTIKQTIKQATKTDNKTNNNANINTIRHTTNPPYTSYCWEHCAPAQYGFLKTVLGYNRLPVETLSYVHNPSLD